MAITRLTPVASDQASATTLVVTLPTGIVNGTLLKMLVTQDINGGSLALYPGWTLDRTDTITNGDHQTIYKLSRISDGTDGATVTITPTVASHNMGAVVYGANGCDNTAGSFGAGERDFSVNNPNLASAPASPVTLVGNSVTANVGDQILIMAAVDGTGANGVFSGLPGTFSSIVQDPSGNQFTACMVADAPVTTGGATGAINSTWTQAGTNGNSLTYVMVLKAAGSGGGSGYTRVGVGAVASAFAAAISPALPAGVLNGDLLLLFTYEYLGSDSPPTISGWTKLTPNTVMKGAALYGRLATGADGASHVWGAGTQWNFGWITAYRGAPGTLAGIVNLSDEKPSNSTASVVTNNAAFTPTKPNCLIVAGGCRNKTGTVNGATFGAFSDATLTIRQQNVPTGSTSAGVFADCMQTAATAIAANNNSVLSILDSSQTFAGFIVALVPSTNSTGTATSAQGQTANAVAGIALTGVGTSAQGETSAAVGNWAIYTTGTTATSQGRESVSAGGTAPLPHAGTYSITGGMPDNVDSTTLTFRVTYGTAFVDQTIFVSKAKTGAGTAGANALTIVLTKPTMMILTYAEGTPVDPTFFNDDGYMAVWSGPSDVTRLCTLSAAGIGCLASVNGTDNVPVAVQPMGYYRLNSLSADTASITLTAFYQGQSVSAVVSVFKAKGGYQIVNSLPTTGNFDGRVVYLTTDGKLYRFVGDPLINGAWTAAVPALDITGQLVDAQIASLAASKVTGILNNVQVASIDAAKILGQLTASQILAAGSGACLSDDPQVADITAWRVWNWGNLPTFFAGQSGAAAGPNLVQSGLPSISSAYSMVGVRGLPLNTAKTYRISAWVYASPSADGTMYLRVSQRDFTNTETLVITVGVEAVSPPASTWTKYAGFFTPTTPLCAPGIILNYGGTNGYMDAQDIRIEEAIGSDLIIAGGVTATNIAAATITGDKIAARTIAAASIVAGSLTAAEIAAAAITATQLAAGSVIAGKIAAGTIQAGDIAANAITGNKIAANTILAGNIAAGTITGDRMDAGAIITATAQITDGVIISAKIGNLQVNSANIADLTVGTQKITSGAISSMVSASGGPYSCTLNNWTVVSPTVTLVHTGAAGSLPNILCFGLANLQNAPTGNITFHLGIFFTDHNTLAALGSKIYYGLWTPGGSGWYGPQTYNHTFHYVLPDPGARTVDAVAQVYTANTGTIVNEGSITMTELRR